jgi:hypothetical protein
MRIPEELKEMLLQPAKESIAFLDANRHTLSFDEIMTLEKLRFAIQMYELEKAHKEGRL